MNELYSGAQALALGAVESGVGLVTGYPGAPATAVVNAILAQTAPKQVQVEWSGNEKVALEVAFGTSLGGQRALLCLKGVGLNLALDPLMAMNLSGCNAGLVILVGDDPGGWGSQNEQDSRSLAQAAETPLLEPTTVPDAREAVRWAFSLSEELGQPILVRFSRALALAQAKLASAQPTGPNQPPPGFRREFMRWVVLPINVVPYHQRLLRTLETVRGRFEASPLNRTHGQGRWGVIAAGFAYQKLCDLLGEPLPPDLRLLGLGTFYPLPAERVTAFVRAVDSVLILEETAPLVERTARAASQRAGLTTPIHGRDTGHVPQAGELFPPDIAASLNRLWPSLALPVAGERGRARPSRQPLCQGCPYIPTFDALSQVMAQAGGRDAFIVVGDPGCMVRAQLPPYELMDVKNSLGSAVGMAAGVALSGTEKRVIALCGDSGFLHSGFNGLVDAARLGVSMLVLILDNGTTALSGGQPHPASRTDARGTPQRPVDLSGLTRQAGADWIRVVDLEAGEAIQPALAAGLGVDGLAVVIARGRCPKWLRG